MADDTANRDAQDDEEADDLSPFEQNFDGLSQPNQEYKSYTATYLDDNSMKRGIFKRKRK